MAQKNGRLYICDRCGETTFCECNGEGERDGGYTRWNTFEEPPEGWGTTRDCEKVFNICPSCNEIYRNMIKTFERYVKVEKYQG